MSQKALKKKANRGKAKGSGFEREISRWIDKWWNVPNGTFWRTTNSGGWKEPGDIAPRLRQGQPPVWFPFVIECKFYRTIEFWNLFNPNVRHNKLVEWWAQVTESQKQSITATRSKKECIRLLIFKENASPVFVAFDGADIPDSGYFNEDLGVHSSILLTTPGPGLPHRLYIMTWDKFVVYLNRTRMERWRVSKS
jgi:hypothetical protein